MDARLTKIISMFDSDNAGVRAAAFNRADAIVQDLGMRWADVLRTLFGSEPMRLSNVEFGHVDQCRDLLRNYPDLLSPWEHRFLRRIIEKIFLSEREGNRLIQIARSVEFRRSARTEFSEGAQ